jgi:hypothetical protein
VTAEFCGDREFSWEASAQLSFLSSINMPSFGTLVQPHSTVQWDKAFTVTSEAYRSILNTGQGDRFPTSGKSKAVSGA